MTHRRGTQIRSTSGHGHPTVAPGTLPRPQVQREPSQWGLTESIAVLWERHRETNLSRLAVLEQGAVALLEGTLDSELRGRGETEARKLAISAGTFGLVQGARLAREVEFLLQNASSLQQREVLRLSELIVALRQELERGPVERSAAFVAENAVLCLLVSADADLAEELVFEGIAHGVETVLATDVAGALACSDDRRPDAILLDLPSVGDIETATWFLEKVGEEPSPVPVLVLADDHAGIDRVEVARLGGRGFLRKPLPAQVVMEAVVHAVGRGRATAARILVVDDNPASQASLKALLSSEGLDVIALDDALRFWEVLDEVAPDLLILDVDIAGTGGTELCRALRNDPRWAALPVLFLAARTDPETVNRIFAAGADDCVRRPVTGPELLTRITNRIDRTRALQQIADIDPLTGAVSQRKAREVATQFLRLAGRHAQPVCVAALDLDRFTETNEISGRAAGDRVLRRVGEILLQTFRGEDIVARWAGDEFVVAMYGMKRTEGVYRLAEVLELLRHEEFAVTLSAGVAQYPDDGLHLNAVLRAATEALGAAQESGGNRVLPAGWRRGQGEAPLSVDVAVVEDNEPLATLLLNALQTRGYRTRWFRDGQTAADALTGPDRQRARLILLDVDLPGLDGLSVVKRLAAEEILGHTRAIMLTMRSSETEILAALELGAFDHIAKPFSLPVLMQRVHQALET